MKKKLLVLAMMGVFTLSSCGKEDIKTAEDLMEKVDENFKPNYNTKLDLSMNVSVSSEGFSYELPVTMSADLDVYNMEKVHGTMDLNTSVFGESIATKAEMYMVADEDSYKTYQSTDGGDWYYSDGSISLDVVSNLKDLVLEGATLEHKDGKYILKQDVSNVIKSDAFEPLVGDISDMFGGNFSVAEMARSVEGNTVVYTFDEKTYALESMSLDDVKMSASSLLNDENVDAEIGLSFTLKNSNFGGIKEDSVTVPEDVEKNAKDSSATDDSIISSDLGDGSLTLEDDTTDDEAA